ncbi:DUF4145 domain-containing protein [Vibrio parahaemolyticus]|uniref:DUF4145 domain-containing protein n=1 Tax=Vibrio parahaemolyticus TaxID=670 RepID=UPI003B673EA9
MELISASKIRNKPSGDPDIEEEKSRRVVYPALMARPEPSTHVPPKYRDDFIESSLVLGVSPKASAALSRRCLQAILRDNANIKKGSLEKEIQQVIDSNQLPSYIAQAIDAIRNIGNFAAHPLKCSSTGEIVEVEVGEAEWNLEVLESLFDFYFVQPALLKEKQEELNKKLASLGKPPMKQGLDKLEG